MHRSYLKYWKCCICIVFREWHHSPNFNSRSYLSAKGYIEHVLLARTVTHCRTKHKTTTTNKLVLSNCISWLFVISVTFFFLKIRYCYKCSNTLAIWWCEFWNIECLSFLFFISMLWPSKDQLLNSFISTQLSIKLFVTKYLN